MFGNQFANYKSIANTFNVVFNYDYLSTFECAYDLFTTELYNKNNSHILLSYD